MFTAFAVGLCMTASVVAQVPSYVPTNGLVGYWPFNGNANDASGNGNNGTVNGATLTTDRFGNSNNAYYFDGVNDYISNILSMNSTDSLTISLWYLSPIPTNISSTHFELWDSNNLSNQIHLNFSFNPIPTGYMYTFIPGIGQANDSMGTRTYNAWHHIVVVKAGITETVYVDNIPNFGQFTGTNSTLNFDKFELGREFTTGGNLTDTYYIGKLDDIGIWNRALTQQEITALYNSCQGTAITSQPSNTSVNIGSNAQLSVNAAVGSTYQWQSNPLNTGWMNLSNNSTYSGSTTNTLTISNTSVSNHNQPFRAIVNSSGCIDTSNVAQIIIGDTCLTTVTDTLIINTTLSLPAPNNENTILIYPNPASDHITIDNGNFAAMVGYSIKIENNAGQQVFQSLINQAQFYVDLSTWSGNGLYFVHLIDPQNNTVTVRKIVLQ